MVLCQVLYLPQKHSCSLFELVLLIAFLIVIFMVNFTMPPHVNIPHLIIDLLSAQYLFLIIFIKKTL